MEGVSVPNAREAFDSRNEIEKKTKDKRQLRSVLLVEGGDEPGPGVSPVVVGRSRRDAEDGRGLLDGQAGEVAELDHFRGAWLNGRESVEGLIKGEEARDASASET